LHFKKETLISTPCLNRLPGFQLGPINLVVYQGAKRPYLGMGFALRCFQRLSLGSLATGLCSWRNNP